MKIGELARQADCPVETVRYYEKQGLLPKPQREMENNYRRYDATHLERLLFIRRCRALDMAHDEIRALLEAMNSDSVSCSPIDTVISQHLEHVQDRIKELKLLEGELKKLRNECDSRRSLEECGIVEKLNASEKVISTIPKKSKHLGGVH
ncbi:MULTISPECIES: Cd(II)/Pb(II)-responsive transcriptional regulator [unclassified Vibrio]|uniref:Cd(II)/Pb(II)-responsive transcriptional regulator n=1 Tax=Vibrio sp. HB236076 TaxID=3232307 RepID=A0AB39HJQ7_9VIBR|nr:Cd(II)/Pb(II)-responsive transcriptional regulator [Vibrio sp. HB161653]MDP5252936.1 Cd(II)/Pb(II)-responsive transcriptional regulator [Vibrio sp. HB161653]